MLHGINSNHVNSGSSAASNRDSFGTLARSADQSPSGGAPRSEGSIPRPTAGLSESGLTGRPAAPIAYSAGAEAQDRGSSASEAHTPTPRGTVVQTLLGSTYNVPADSGDNRGGVNRVGGGFVAPTPAENTQVGTGTTEDGGRVVQTLLGSTYSYPAEDGGRVAQTPLGVTYSFPADNDAPAGPPPNTVPILSPLGSLIFVPVDTGASAPTETPGTATGGGGTGTDTTGTGSGTRVTARITQDENGDPIVTAQGTPGNATLRVNGQGVDLQTAINDTDGPVESPGTGTTAPEVTTPAGPADTAGNDTDTAGTGSGTRVTARITQDENGDPIVTAQGTPGNATLRVNDQGVDLQTAIENTDGPVDNGGINPSVNLNEPNTGDGPRPSLGPVTPAQPQNDRLTPSASLNIDGNEDNVTARINGNVVEPGDPIFGPREPIDLTPAGEGNSDGVVESNGFVIGTEGDDTLVSTDPGNTNFNALGGDDTLVAGEGDDRLSGGEGVDTFVINNNGGRDRIFDFDADAGETITVNVDGIDSFSDLQDVASGSSSRVQFDFTGGNSLDVFGLSVDDLDARNFNFNA